MTMMIMMMMFTVMMMLLMIWKIMIATSCNTLLLHDRHLIAIYEQKQEN